MPNDIIKFWAVLAIHGHELKLMDGEMDLQMDLNMHSMNPVLPHNFIAECKIYLVNDGNITEIDNSVPLACKMVYYYRSLYLENHSKFWQVIPQDAHEIN